MTGDVEEAKARGYAAIWGSGWLTDDAYVNARIWRAVTVALDAALETANAPCTAPGGGGRCVLPAGHDGPHFA